MLQVIQVTVNMTVISFHLVEFVLVYLELTLPPAPWVLFPDEDELPRG